MPGVFAILQCFVYLGTSAQLDCRVMPWGTFPSAEACQASLEERLPDFSNGSPADVQEHYVCAERNVAPKAKKTPSRQ